MYRKRASLFVIAAALGSGWELSAMAAPATTLAAMRWQHRILIVFAPPGDPRLARQREMAGAAAAGMRERDLRVVEVVGGSIVGASDSAESARRLYAVVPDAFAAILIGKDGGEKLRSDAPIAAARLFATIDSMPMRRSEAAR